MNRKKTAVLCLTLTLALGIGATIWLASLFRESPSTGSATFLTATQARHAMAPPPTPEGTALTARLQPVAAHLVCMVNNRVFPNPQIPVAFEGRTYYGCCEGCKQNLMTNRQARMAVDPVSGQEVDKALAVIGSLPDGRVFYFKSPENLSAFDPAKVN